MNYNIFSNFTLSIKSSNILSRTLSTILYFLPLALLPLTNTSLAMMKIISKKNFLNRQFHQLNLTKFDPTKPVIFKITRSTAFYTTDPLTFNESLESLGMPLLAPNASLKDLFLSSDEPFLAPDTRSNNLFLSSKRSDEPLLVSSPSLDRQFTSSEDEMLVLQETHFEGRLQEKLRKKMETLEKKKSPSKNFKSKINLLMGIQTKTSEIFVSFDDNSEGFEEKVSILSACKDNDLESATKLILNGNNYINVKDSSNNTPLHYACDKNNLELAQLLLSNGAIKSVNKKNIDKKTPLYYACDKNNTELVKLLLLNGADFEDETIKEFLTTVNPIRTDSIIKLFNITKRLDGSILDGRHFYLEDSEKNSPELLKFNTDLTNQRAILIEAKRSHINKRLLQLLIEAKNDRDDQDAQEAQRNQKNQKNKPDKDDKTVQKSTKKDLSDVDITCCFFSKND